MYMNKPDGGVEDFPLTIQMKGILEAKQKTFCKEFFLRSVYNPYYNPKKKFMMQTIYLVFLPIFNLQSLLCDPNPNSPANSEAARMFSENRREYNRRVREIVEQSWTAD